MLLAPVTVGEADWTAIRPFKVTMWIGADAQSLGGEPILETIILAPLPKKP
jgi:hypothetical protein